MTTVTVAMVATTTPVCEAAGSLPPCPTIALSLVGTATDPPGCTIMAVMRANVVGRGRPGTPSQPPTTPPEQVKAQWTEDYRTFSRPVPNPCTNHCRRSSTTTSLHLLPKRTCEGNGCAKWKSMSGRRRRPLFNWASLRATRRQHDPRQAGRLFSTRRASLLPLWHP